MNLRLDFVEDWCRTLREVMSSDWGYDVSAVPNDELPRLYFNAELRRPDLRPRKVKTAKGFTCPHDLQSGWKRLKTLVEEGGDLTPNLSKFVRVADKSDEMLFDWGVYHFHLGDLMSGNLVSRTGPLLFALVTPTVFYAIGVFSHGDWANEQVVEVIHQNWPEALQAFRMPIGPSIDLAKGDRTSVRRAGMNVGIETRDGTVYLPPGGGLTLARTSVLAERNAIRQKKFLKELERGVIGQVEQIEEILRDHGDIKKDEIVAVLAIAENSYSLEFEEFGVSILIFGSA